MNRTPDRHSLYGQYLPGNSTLHKLNAGIKMLCFCLLLVAVIGSGTVSGYLFLAAITLLLTKLSGLSVRTATASLPKLWRFFLLIFLMNAFFYNSSEPIWTWWILNLSVTGMVQGLHVVVRVVLLMIFGNLLLAVTPPQEITSSLASFLKPLSLLHVPVGEVAMILSAALQFLPTLSKEAELIQKAQIARGARFESRNLIQRAASYLPMVLPVFLSAFRRADELAMAMEARGYQSNTTISVSKNCFHKRDLAALGTSAVVCVIQFACFH